MILSLNEIETAIRRAATGAGFPYGLAEDAGRAAAWLAGRGLDGVGAALASLERGAAQVAAQRSPAGWKVTGGRVAVAGPAASDLLAASEPGTEVTVEAPDEPLLLIGYVGFAIRSYGGHIVVDGAGRTIARISAEDVALQGPLPASPPRLRLVHQPGEAAALPRAPASGVKVDDALWRRALALAARSYVPATEASRLRGAGAGLTDND